jgi:hypothetical protein
MHACGHDAHVAILMGVAELLASMRAELPGSVLFIFQPAEEGPPEGEEGGAELMLKEGLFDWHRPDAVFGLHVWSPVTAGQIGYQLAFRIASGQLLGPNQPVILQLLELTPALVAAHYDEDGVLEEDDAPREIARAAA